MKISKLDLELFIKAVAWCVFVVGVLLITLGKLEYYDPINICFSDYVCSHSSLYCANITSMCSGDTIRCGNICVAKKDLYEATKITNPDINIGIGMIASGSVVLGIGFVSTCLLCVI